ncbi:MAG: hypothetical protein F4053_13015 [Proteobacteria bacterium]|nr:hypothetical protein [Pseudomonadota bacterium]
MSLRERLIATRPKAALSTNSSLFLFGGGVLAVVVILGWSIAVASKRLLKDTDAHQTSIGAGPNALARPSDAIRSAAVAGVRDADQHGGIWFLLDRYSAEVHRVDGRGVYHGSFAGKGDGPGELRFPQAIAAHADTIVVATWRNMHLYQPDGTSIARRRIEPPRDCPGALVHDIASSRLGLLILFNCDHGSDFESLVVLENDEVSRYPLAVRAASPVDRRVWTAFREAFVLASHPQGFLFGHPDDDCLELYGLDGEVLDSVCHAWLERHPIRVEDLDRWKEVNVLMRTVGVVPHLPEHYPPFDGVFVQDDTVLFYRTQSSDQLSVLRQFGEQADTEASLQILPASQVFISDHSVLALWYDLSGTWIGVYDVVDG